MIECQRFDSFFPPIPPPPPHSQTNLHSDQFPFTITPHPIYLGILPHFQPFSAIKTIKSSEFIQNFCPYDLSTIHPHPLLSSSPPPFIPTPSFHPHPLLSFPPPPFISTPSCHPHPLLSFPPPLLTPTFSFYLHPFLSFPPPPFIPTPSCHSHALLSSPPPPIIPTPSCHLHLLFNAFKTQLYFTHPPPPFPHQIRIQEQRLQLRSDVAEA